MKKYAIIIGEVAICLLAILIISVAKSKGVAGWIPNLIMIAMTVAVFFIARQEIPKWGMALPILGSISCLIAHFSRIGFKQGLAIWFTVPMLIVAVVAFLAKDWQDEKAKERKEADKEPEKIRLQKDRDDALATIDQEEITHFLRLAQTIENAKDDLTAFATTMATHESQWQERLRIALLPFDNEIATVTSEVGEKEAAFDEASLDFKNCSLQKCPKGTNSTDIDNYYRRQTDTERAKNTASTELKAAERTLAAKQADRTREEQNQQNAISVLRNADQVALQELQAALRTAERAKTLAEATDKSRFESRRREANANYDEAIARLK